MQAISPAALKKTHFSFPPLPAVLCGREYVHKERASLPRATRPSRNRPNGRPLPNGRGAGGRCANGQCARKSARKSPCVLNPAARTQNASRKNYEAAPENFPSIFRFSSGRPANGRLPNGRGAGGRCANGQCVRKSARKSPRVLNPAARTQNASRKKYEVAQENFPSIFRFFKRPPGEWPPPERARRGWAMCEWAMRAQIGAQVSARF